MIDEEVVFKYPQKKDWVTISLVNGQDVKVLLPDEHVEVTNVHNSFIYQFTDLMNKF